MTLMKYNKKYTTFVCVFQFLLGIYISSLRLYDLDAMNLFNAFAIARETDYIDLTSDMFDVQILVSLLNIIISIPLVSNIFIKNYNSKICFVATRMKKYLRFFFKEMLNLFEYSLLCELLYCLGILVFCIYKCTDLMFDVKFIKYFVLSVVNSLLLLFVFVLVEVILSVILNEKIGMLLSVTTAVSTAVMLYILPVTAKQYNIFSWYFLTEFPNNKELFKYNAEIYYFLLIILIVMIIVFEFCLLKKKDIL